MEKHGTTYPTCKICQYFKKLNKDKRKKCICSCPDSFFFNKKIGPNSEICQFIKR